MAMVGTTLLNGAEEEALKEWAEGDKRSLSSLVASILSEALKARRVTA